MSGKTSGKTSGKAGEYTAKNLKIVEGLRHVRVRPGMYIGSTGPRGLHHLVEELVDNSIDEHMAGHCGRIDVEVKADGSVTVSDDGRGIPVDRHRESGLSGLELVLTRLGGGGKWGSHDSGYRVSGGLHGVGASVVNACSKSLEAEVRRDGRTWRQSYERGSPTGPVRDAGRARGTGTRITFRYDDSVLDPGLRLDRETLERRLRELSYLNPGLILVLRFPGHAEEKFVASGGLADYVAHLVRDREAVEPVNAKPILLGGEVPSERASGSRSPIRVEVALQWTTGQQELALSFVNCVATQEGGTHLQGARAGLRRSIVETARQLGKLRGKDPFTQEDCREGLFSAISVRVADPQFEGQTKMKLGNTDVQRAVETFVATQLREELMAARAKRDAARILARVAEARDGRIASKRAREAVTKRKGLLGGSGLPGKLADCISRKAQETELFLVEGDSAGGGMKQGRDRTTQAVLPLRGKILNSEKAGSAALSADVVKDLLTALGGEIITVEVPTESNGKPGKRRRLQVDLPEPRYGKVVICTDADVDGGHIVTLLLTFFFRYAPSIIEEGRLHIADLPLYRVEHKRKGRQYIHTDGELKRLLDRGEVKRRSDGTPEVQRFKGLGEMMPAQLAELALHPKTRHLKRVVVDDLPGAEDITTLLMGNRVDRRREYIEENALTVEADV